MGIAAHICTIALQVNEKGGLNGLEFPVKRIISKSLLRFYPNSGYDAVNPRCITCAKP